MNSTSFVNGMAIGHTQTHPENPTLVFLHDSLGCIDLWRDFPAKLGNATECNVLVYDRLGYGKSDAIASPLRPVDYLEQEADLLYELLIALQIDDAILFGHSDGGSIALLAAGKYPQLVHALIAEAAHIFVEDITLQGIHKAIDAYQHTNLAERLKKYHGTKTDTLFKAWTETWTRPDYRNWNIEHVLPHIHCPLLFIQGEADEYGTLDQVERTVGQVCGIAERCIIPDIGHTPHKEAPEATLMASAAFVRMTLSAR